MTLFCPNCYVSLPKFDQTSMVIDGDDSTPSTALSSSTSTHPSSLTPPSHYNEFSDWVEEANLALEGAFPIHRQPRNSKVGVLLLRFENDGLGVISEIAELQSVFVNIYGFETEVWNVPDEDPQKHLSSKLYDFIKSYCADSSSQSDQLPQLIVYYGGHAAKPRSDQNASLWASKAEGPCAQLNWTVVQAVLFDAPADVLVLLDCCYASTAASHAEAGPIGSKETIAACGPASKAFGVGESSFTTALISELKDHAQKQTVLTSVGLASFLVKNHRLKFQPVYIRSDPASRRNSACIIPFLRPESQSHADIWDDSRREGYSVTIRVLLSVHSRKSPTSELIGFLKNERAMSTDVMGISIENINRFRPVAAFASFSTLTLVSIPLAAWYLLPDHEACHFIGLVTSENLLDDSSQIGWDFAKAGERRDPLFGQASELEDYKHMFKPPSPPMSDSALGSEIPYDSDSDSISNADDMESAISILEGRNRDTMVAQSMFPHEMGLLPLQARIKRSEVSADLEKEERKAKRACLRCHLFRIRCDDKDPCTPCRRSIRTWQLGCTRLRLEDKSTFLVPGVLTETLASEVVHKFMNANAMHWRGDAFYLPLTLNVGKPLHILVREVEPLGPELLSMRAFAPPLASGPGDTQKMVLLQSPPLLPYQSTEENSRTYDRIRGSVLEWSSSMVEVGDIDWAGFLFPKANEELERRLLDQILEYAKTLGATQDSASDTIQLGLRLLFFNIAMSRAFVVPEEELEMLARHLPGIRSSLKGSIVSPRAVNRFLKMLLLPMLKELVESVFARLQKLVISRTPIGPDVMIVLTVLVLAVIGRTQDSIFQRELLADPMDGSTNRETSMSKEEAQNLVTSMDLELSSCVIGLSAVKVRRWRKRGRNASNFLEGILHTLNDEDWMEATSGITGFGEAARGGKTNTRRLIQKFHSAIATAMEPV